MQYFAELKLKKQDLQDIKEQFYVIALEQIDYLYQQEHALDLSKLRSRILTYLHRYVGQLLKYHKYHVLASSFDNAIGSSTEYTDQVILKADLQNILTQREYRVVMLKYEHGMSNEQISKYLGIPLRTVERILQRVRYKLQDYISL